MADADVTALLREHGLRVTPQRRAILQTFSGARDEHLSAEEVAARASITVPSIGRGTVYAALAELAEVGLLASVGRSEPVRYETNLGSHDHFRCRLCMRLFDVTLDGDEITDRRLEGFTIESIAVEAEGICADCHAYRLGLCDGAARCLSHQTLAADELGSLSCAKVDSPLGELAVAASAEGIIHLAFSDHADFHGLLARARSRRGSGVARGRLTALTSALEEYFAGGQAPIDDLIDWRLLDGEQRRALTSVRRIPFAAHLSYEHLESELAAYARGHLMGANPLPLVTPCHRVSRGSERPEVYAGGTERLHVLQALETS